MYRSYGVDAGAPGGVNPGGGAGSLAGWATPFAIGLNPSAIMRSYADCSSTALRRRASLSASSDSRSTSTMVRRRADSVPRGGGVRFGSRYVAHAVSLRARRLDGGGGGASGGEGGRVGIEEEGAVGAVVVVAALVRVEEDEGEAVARRLGRGMCTSPAASSGVRTAEPVAQLSTTYEPGGMSASGGHSHGSRLMDPSGFSEPRPHWS